MPKRKTVLRVAKESNDAPKTVEELTAANVKTIADLERATLEDRSPTDRMAGHITSFCGSMPFVWVHVIWFTVWIFLDRREFQSL